MSVYKINMNGVLAKISPFDNPKPKFRGLDFYLVFFFFSISVRVMPHEG